MVRSASARLIRVAAATLFAGALGGACGSSPPRDKNFGSDLGADFRAPNVDASSDTNVTPGDGAAGAAAGAAGTGAAGDSGSAGAGGAATGAAGDSGSAGAGGAGGDSAGGAAGNGGAGG